MYPKNADTLWNVLPRFSLKNMSILLPVDASKSYWMSFKSVDPDQMMFD